MAGIGLNTVEEDEEEGGPVAEPGRGAVCLELWHACAGPVGPLPRKGSAVVYLPQGHLEHIGDSAGAGSAAAAAVPAHVFCRVVDVNLQLLDLSGILTVFFCGIVMSHYTWHNVTESSRITTKHAFATLSFISETFLILYIGMDALDIEKWKIVSETYR